MQEPVTVLVIDDDEMIRTILQNALSNRGFEVLTAGDGLDGLDIAKNKEIDVILLDWMMPEMDGMEVLQELKRSGDTMHIPVFMLTSKEDSKDIELAIKKGAVDYIIKSFRPNEVPEIVLRYLEKVHSKHTGKHGLLSKIFSRHS